MNPLSILFAGGTTTATLIDGSRAEVYIRAMPQRWLARVIEAAEFPTALVELCTYVRPAPLNPSTVEPLNRGTVEPPAPPSHSDIPPPAGYDPVPPGWTDNLSDESVDALYELAKKLNFQRAIDWAAGQIAAKKLVAPLHEQAINQVMPLALKIMEPLMKRLDALSNSTPSAPSSSAPAANNS
ncbi:MAG: hypothetical protein AAB368_07050 [bacterium]